MDVFVGYLWVFFLCVVFFCVNGVIIVGVSGCVCVFVFVGIMCVYLGGVLYWVVGWAVGRAGGWAVVFFCVFFVGCGLAWWLGWKGGSPQRLSCAPPPKAAELCSTKGRGSP